MSKPEKSVNKFVDLVIGGLMDARIIDTIAIRPSIDGEWCEVSVYGKNIIKAYQICQKTAERSGYNIKGTMENKKLTMEIRT